MFVQGTTLRERERKRETVGDDCRSIVVLRGIHTAQVIVGSVFDDCNVRR